VASAESMNSAATNASPMPPRALDASPTTCTLRALIRKRPGTLVAHATTRDLLPYDFSCARKPRDGAPTAMVEVRFTHYPSALPVQWRAYALGAVNYPPLEGPCLRPAPPLFGSATGRVALVLVGEFGSG